MRYYSLIGADGDARLAVEARDGVLADLTSLHEELVALEDLALAAALSGESIDALARRLLDGGTADEYDLAEIMDGDGNAILDMPFEAPEVWAAGVTYKTSEMERRRESETPDVYSMVYSAERPEVFFKATPERCVGPNDSVGIREDSNWNVPEPELAFVLYAGEIIGYTIGNDMSSRQIEGENPLYLPQAKVYSRCCAIGPSFVTAESIGDPHSLDVSCTITRDGEQVFSGSTNTSQMARTCEELAEWLQRHNDVPNMTAVLTGTSIVPPPDFTLQEGDIVTIAIANIGTLVNDVIVV
ncbi:MAG: fumarylacetoacetate hydrolase family protein [Chloroflexota bacterium]|nr:fumarylacetoacetate hydrolase family protein [Chloroflexota bacterium]